MIYSPPCTTRQTDSRCHGQRWGRALHCTHQLCPRSPLQSGPPDSVALTFQTLRIPLPCTGSCHSVTSNGKKKQASVTRMVLRSKKVFDLSIPSIAIIYGGYAYPHFLKWWSGGPVPPLFGCMTEKHDSNFPPSSAHVSPYNIQENVWRPGLCPRNQLGAHIAPTSSYVPVFKESNRYNLGSCSLMFASISGQMAPTSSFISHFGPHLPLLFKLH